MNVSYFNNDNVNCYADMAGESCGLRFIISGPAANNMYGSLYSATLFRSTRHAVQI